MCSLGTGQQVFAIMKHLFTTHPPTLAVFQQRHFIHHAALRTTLNVVLPITTLIAQPLTNMIATIRVHGAGISIAKGVLREVTSYFHFRLLKLG